MDEEQQLRVQRGERKKEVGGQTNEAEGCRSPDIAFLFLVSLRSDGHRGLFGSQGGVVETKQEKVKIELLKDKQIRG